MSPIMTVDQVTMHAHAFQNDTYRFIDSSWQARFEWYVCFSRTSLSPLEFLLLLLDAWILPIVTNILVVRFPRNRNSKSISTYKRPIRSSVKHSIIKHGANGLSKYTAVNTIIFRHHHHRHVWRPMLITSNISCMNHSSHHVSVRLTLFSLIAILFSDFIF